jgi:FAD/FMN-containing dehydrogenase
MVLTIPNRPWVNWSGDQQVVAKLTYFPKSLGEVVETVVDAEERSLRLHAFGSGWSFSNAPVGEAMVDTSGLDNLLALSSAGHALGPSVLTPAALARRTGLALVEGGRKISDLYAALVPFRLALPTFGGSAGQSLAGALATASHGGDLDRKPLADWVHALHLVGENGKQYWVERSTGGPFADEAKLRAAPFGSSSLRIIRSDNALNAAVAACGRMGIIYSMLLEVVPLFYLEERRTHVPWPVIEVAARGGFDSLHQAFRLRGKPLHFLQVVRTLDGDYPLAFVTQRIRTSSTSFVPRPPEPDLSAEVLFHHSDWIGILSGDVRTLGNRMNGLSNDDVRAIMRFVLPRYVMPHEVQGPYSYVMDGGEGPLRVQCAEYGFDANAAAYLDFIEAVIQLAKSPQVPGVMALRYTPKSAALLAISRFPDTVHIEIASPRGYDANDRFFERVQRKALQYGGVPHLGQRNEMSPVQMKAVFGDALIQWRKELTKLSGRSQRRTFSNAFSVARGLEPIGHDNLLLLG